MMKGVFVTSTPIIIFVLLINGLFLPYGQAFNERTDGDLENAATDDDNDYRSTHNTNINDISVSIVENLGQRNDCDVFYYSQGGAIPAVFGPAWIAFALTPEGGSEGLVYRIDFLQANDVIPKGVDEQVQRSNYFYGNVSDDWVTGARHFESILYEDLWDGVDLHYRCTINGWKYEFRLDAGILAERIRISYVGIEGVEVDGTTRGLKVHTGFGTVFDTAPIAFQEDEDGNRVGVHCEYLRLDERTIGFGVKDINPTRSLIIDPELSWSTYVGSDGEEKGHKTCFDDQGNVYVIGHSDDWMFPSTPGAYDTSINGNTDVVVMKFDPDGNSLKFSTFLGGSQDEIGYYIYIEPPLGDICVDSKGWIYISGATSSSSYPTTSGAYQEQIIPPGSWPDVFVTKLSADGSSLAFSTFIGTSGTDIGYAIAVDDNGSVYLGGASGSGFPTTSGAFNESGGSFHDGFILKMNPAGSSLEYSTLIPGSSTDVITDIVIDDEGCAYATGWTQSDDFPTTTGAYDESHNGITWYDVFVLKLNKNGSGLEYSTFVGSTRNEEGNAIDVDDQGRAYVTGFSTGGFRTTQDAYDRYYTGGKEVFILRMSDDGTELEASTYLGGDGDEVGMDLKIGPNGNVHMTGYAVDGFPTTEDAYDDTHNGGYDVVLVQMDPDLEVLQYSTYIGGSYSDEGWGLDVDDEGDACITGWTKSGSFPTHNAYDNTFNGGTADIFVLKHKGLRPPEWASPGTLAAVEDEQYVLDCTKYLTDPDTPYSSLDLSVISPYLDYIVGMNVTLTFPNGVINASVDFTVKDKTFTVDFTVHFEVEPVNDPPEISLPAQIPATEDVPLILDLAKYIVDVDDEFSNLTVTVDPTYATLDDGNLTLVFPDGVTEYDLILNVDDGKVTASKTIRFTITPVNDAPVVTDPGTIKILEDEVTPFNLTPFLSDVDSPLDTLTVSINNRNCTVNGQNLILLFERGGFRIPLDVRVSDGISTTQAVLLVVVEEVDDPPTIGQILPQYFREDELGEVDLAPFISDEDTDIDLLEIQCDHPSVISVSGFIISFLYTVETPDHMVTFTVSDNSSSIIDSFEVSVRPTNDPVVVTDFGGLEEPYSVELEEGSSMWLQISATDEDNKILVYSVTPLEGVATVYENGSLLISTDFGQVGTHEHVIRVSDHDGSNVDLELEVIITNVNEPPGVPVIRQPRDGSTFTEGENITFRVEVADPDIPFGDVLTVTWMSNVSGTIKELTGSDEYSFTTNTLAVGTHSIRVTVSDGEYAEFESFEIFVEPRDVEPEPPNGDDPSGGSSERMTMLAIIVLVLVAVAVLTVFALKRTRKGDGQ